MYYTAVKKQLVRVLTLSPAAVAACRAWRISAGAPAAAAAAAAAAQ
jgi:hypothetical protein